MKLFGILLAVGAGLLALVSFVHADMDFSAIGFSGGHSPAAELGIDNEFDDACPSLALGLDGEPHIVWVGFEDEDGEIFYAYRDSGVWSRPAKLTDNFVSDTSPAVVIDLNGTVWVAWCHFDGEDDEIYCMHSDASGWSVPVQVNKEDSMPDICPVLKLSSEGVVSISWRGYDGKRYSVYSSCWDGEKWSEEEVKEAGEVKEVTEVEEEGEGTILGVGYSGVIVEDKYVGFGDSITWGARSTQGGYGPVLEEKLRTIYPGAVVVLYGVGGERTSDGVERIDSVLAEEDGEYMLILEGTNDIQAGISRETILFNLKEMVKKTIEYGSIPVLGTLPPRRDLEMWNSWTERLNEQQIRPYAQQEKILLADHWDFFYAEPDWEALIGRKDEHPNDAGYAVMADCWFVALEEDLPPSGLTAVIAGKTVRLSWEENSEAGFEGYNVYRRAPYQADYEKLNDCLVTEVNYCDEELSYPYNYYYAVTAVDRCGNESDYSIEVGIGLSSEDGGGCFIATAACGVNSIQVSTLRNFRDRHLLMTIPGRKLVSFYYLVGPGISSFVSANEFIRVSVRVLLVLPVLLSRAVLGMGEATRLLVSVLFWGTLFGLMLCRCIVLSYSRFS